MVLLAFVVACHAKQGQFYRIDRGDTAYRIAHLHEITVQDIQEANPQKNLNRLKAGESLWIPSTLKQTKKANQAMRAALPSSATSATPKPRKPNQPVVSRPSSKAPPLYWPYSGKVIGRFGMHNKKMHNGIDIEIPASETIGASQKGQVVYVGKSIEGYGLTVIVQHDGYLFTVYSYLGQALVEKGQSVSRGQAVGKPQSQGDTPFFHFEIRKVKTALDPLQLLRHK
jgi:murein DD-endopeptidase MepM/ murein hydrolase activator NlpD